MNGVAKMNPACSFPDPRRAPREAPLAFGGDLSVDRLLAAYRQGIFPWYEQGEPILWWSPDPRFVLFPNAVRGTSSLMRTLKEPSLTVTLDTAFAEVIEACAKIPRHGQTGTWITTEMIGSYLELHRSGYAHSVECRRDGVLAGGLYGVSLGAVFFGESMFHRVNNASKVAFFRLAELLTDWDFEIIDCQVPTRHMASLGAREMPRKIFLDLLEKALCRPTRLGPWEFPHRSSKRPGGVV